MIKGILFDMDNTLLDFMYYKRETAKATAKAMVEKGLPANEKEIYKKIFEIYDEKGIEYQKTCYDVVKPYNLEIHRAEKIQHAGIIAYIRKKYEIIKPYPGVKKTLKKIKEKKIKMGIVSDAPRNKIWDRLILSGLEDEFEVVVSQSDTLKYKPHPSSFQLALQKIKLKPNEILFVGDNPGRDIKGAKKIGMKTCLAKYGQEFYSKDKADYVLEKIEDLLNII
jgi:HAD superfamily hydrolase (TIGR02253 family)